MLIDNVPPLGENHPIKICWKSWLWSMRFPDNEWSRDKGGIVLEDGGLAILTEREQKMIDGLLEAAYTAGVQQMQNRISTLAFHIMDEPVHLMDVMEGVKAEEKKDE